jgi:hypothetical protein
MGNWAMVSQRGLGGLPHERLANPEGGTLALGMGEPVPQVGFPDSRA